MNEAEVCPDHIHMFVEPPPKMSVSSFVEFLKGKSILTIHERHGNLKYKYGSCTFWYKGHYVDTAGKNKKRLWNISETNLKKTKFMTR